MADPNAQPMPDDDNWDSDDVIGKANELGGKLGQPSAKVRSVIASASDNLANQLQSNRQRPVVLLLIMFACITTLLCPFVSIFAFNTIRGWPIPSFIAQFFPGPQLPTATPEIAKISYLKVADINHKVSDAPIPSRLVLPQSASEALKYVVRPAEVGADGNWALDSKEKNVALWLAGTAPNYVVAIPDPKDGRRIVDGINLGNTVTLFLGQDGRETSIGFDVISKAAVNAKELVELPQTLPQLKGKLLPYVIVVFAGKSESGSDKNDVIIATLRTDASKGDTAAQGMRVSSAFIEGALTKGFSVFVQDYQWFPPANGPARLRVTFEIGNNDADVIDVGQFTTQLIDGDAAGARQIGEVIPQNGTTTLEKGKHAQFTTEYLITSTLTSNDLIWRFFPNKNNRENSVKFRLPIDEPIEIKPTPTVVPLSRSRAGIEVLAAKSLTNDLICIVVRITNNSNDPLPILEKDVKLTTAKGELKLVGNELPNTIVAGDSSKYQLNFEHPGQDISELLFTVLDKTYLIEAKRQ